MPYTLNAVTLVSLVILLTACSYKDNANTQAATTSSPASSIASADVNDLAIDHTGNVIVSKPVQPAPPPVADELPDQLPPFAGSREFNFDGGAQTVKEITIQDNGFTIIKEPSSGEGVDMKFSTTFKGQFANPIKLKDGTGLLFKDNKVFRLVNGKIDSSCIDAQSGQENIPCASELDESN
jgi:hypothetical protein